MPGADALDPSGIVCPKSTTLWEHWMQKFRGPPTGLCKGLCGGCAGVVRAFSRISPPLGVSFVRIWDIILRKPWTGLKSSVKSLRKEMVPFPCHACWLVS